MPHSYASCLVHYVFSTKHRHKTISPELRERLWPYLGGIARENDMRALAVGGTDDHVHMLASVPATMTIAKAVQLVKGGSSKWVHDTFAHTQGFRLAGGLRSIQHRHFGRAGYDCLYQLAGRAPSGQDV